MKRSFLRKALALTLSLTIAAGLLLGCKKTAGTEGSSASGNVSEYDKGDTIKVGVQGDISGDLAWPQPYNGVMLALETINDNGGLLGKKIEIIDVDTQSDTSRYQEMANKLIKDDKCCIVMGNGTSSAREAMRPLFEENKVLYLYGSNYEGGVTSKYVLATGTTPAHNIYDSLIYAKEKIGNSVYIVAADYNYGQLTAAWVKEFCKKIGIEIAGEEYIPLGDSQFSTVINNIQQAAPAMVYTLCVGAAQRSFFDQWAATGLNKDIKIVSSCNLAGTYEYRQIDPPALSGAVTSAIYMEELENCDDRTIAAKAKEFNELWRSKYPEEEYITGDCYNNYWATMAWAEAVKAAGSCDPENVLKAISEGKATADSPFGAVAIDPATHGLRCGTFVFEVDDEHHLKMVKHVENITDNYWKDLKGFDLRKDELFDFYTLLD